MKTKIEYSVDLQDVPKNLQSKLQELSGRLVTLGNYVDSIQQDLEHETIGSIAARIDRTRRQLLQVDTGLDDCDTALRTYGDTVREIRRQQTEAPPQPSPTEGDDA